MPTTCVPHPQGRRQRPQLLHAGCPPAFQDEYRGSEEERGDLLRRYEEFKGRMHSVRGPLAAGATLCML